MRPIYSLIKILALGLWLGPLALFSPVALANGNGNGTATAKKAPAKTAVQKPAAKTPAKKQAAAKGSAKKKPKTSASPKTNPKIRTITITPAAPSAAALEIPSSNPNAFTAAKASLNFTVNGTTIPYQRFFYTTPPGKTLTFALSNTWDPYEIAINNQIIPSQQHQWVWQAPSTPGLYNLTLTEKLTHKTLNLSIFVLATLAPNSTSLNGFKIGRYPAPKHGKKEYLPPKGFIEVNTKNANLWLSPHFQLGRFVCKQKCKFPVYVALEPALIEKLERLLEAYNAQRGPLHTFEIMSGYRTPSYNKSIRNVPHSRHIYGSAADIFVDINPKDGKMDDLNKDGKYNKLDAAYLYNLADTISEKYPHLSGGIGQYSANSAHGPFVHIDVRGSEARWGN